MTEMKFEDALGKLEQIVQDMEGGTLSLDESLKRYEEGVKLAQFCTKKLEAARKKVGLLVKTQDGKFQLKPMGSASDEKND